MKHVIVRKKIDLKVVFYLAVAIVAIPFLFYQFVLTVRMSRDLNESKRLLNLRSYPAAWDKLKQVHQTYGLKKKALMIELNLLSEYAAANENVGYAQRLLQIARILDEASWWPDHRLSYFRGRAYYQLGQDYYDAALRELGIYEKRFPKDENALLIARMRFEMALSKNYLAEAEKEADRLIRLDPKNLEYPIQKVAVVLKKGEKLRARQLLHGIVFSYVYGDELKTSARLLLNLLTEFNLVEDKDFLYTYLMEKSNRELSWVMEYSQFLFENKQVIKARNLLAGALSENKNTQEIYQLLAKMY